MKHRGLWTLTAVAVAGLLLAGCGGPAAAQSKAEAIHVEEQASGLKKLTLSERAAERLGIETAVVVDRGRTKAVPYAAVIYDAQGGTWVYAGSEALAFERHTITIETIDGDEATLSEGPPAGTPVVIVGAAELYGAETGVGGGH